MNASARASELLCCLRLVEGRNYVSYILEQDPITFGDIDIIQLLNDYKASHQDYKKGEPIYMLGRDLKQYRK